MTAPGSKPQPDDPPLIQSINDAQVLLWYATREEKRFSDAMVQTIVEAQSLTVPGASNAALEGQFWLAFRDLAAAVRPVSVDFIIATYGYPFGAMKRRGTALGNAVRTKRLYSMGAVVVLALLLVTQIYWYIGTAFRTDLDDHRDELDRISGTLRDLRFRDLVLSSEIVMKAAQARAVQPALIPTKLAQGGSADTPVLPAPAAGPASDTRLIALLDSDTNALRAQRHQINIDFVNSTRRIERLNLILSGDQCLLDRWDSINRGILGLIGMRADVLRAGVAAVGPLRRSGRPTQASAGGLWSPGDHDGIDLQGPLDSQVGGSPGAQPEPYKSVLDQIYKSLVGDQQTIRKVERSLEGSKSMLAVLNQYILPLLYGVLGALAYTLRALSREIQSVTFTRGSDIRYSLRWPLGMLAGVTVGLFFDPHELRASPPSRLSASPSSRATASNWSSPGSINWCARSQAARPTRSSTDEAVSQ